MDIVTAYRQVATYRGVAEMCGVTHKTVKRAVDRAAAGGAAQERVERCRNDECLWAVVAAEIEGTHGKVTAKRLLPKATAAGSAGPPRNFRRLVATERSRFR